MVWRLESAVSMMVSTGVMSDEIERRRGMDKTQFSHAGSDGHGLETASATEADKDQRR